MTHNNNLRFIGLLTTACAMFASVPSDAFEAVFNVPPAITEDLPPYPPRGGVIVESNMQLNVFDGGVIESDLVVGDDDGEGANSEFNMYGGQIAGRMFTFAGSVTNIADGIVGTPEGFSSDNLHSVIDGVVNFSGGTLIGQIDFFRGVINISGGEVGTVSTITFDDTQINLSGGRVDSVFANLPNVELNISGGVIESMLAVTRDTDVHIVGKHFSVDGIPISDLAPRDTRLIEERDVLLSGVLVDGSSFAYALSPTFDGRYLFDPLARVSVTLVPEPSTPVAVGCLLALRWAGSPRVTRVRSRQLTVPREL